MSRNSLRITQTTPEASPASKDSYLRLGAAVLANASREARAGDVGAIEWLLGDISLLTCAMLGIDYQVVQARARDWAQKPAGTIIIRLEVER